MSLHSDFWKDILLAGCFMRGWVACIEVLPDSEMDAANAAPFSMASMISMKGGRRARLASVTCRKLLYFQARLVRVWVADSAAKPIVRPAPCPPPLPSVIIPSFSSPSACTCEPQSVPASRTFKTFFFDRRHVFSTAADRFPVFSIHVHSSRIDHENCSFASTRCRRHLRAETQDGIIHPHPQDHRQVRNVP